MSKAILLSVKPQYVAKILNGEKTIEIRKHAIPVGTKVYIYVTKNDNALIYGEIHGFGVLSKRHTKEWIEMKSKFLNGKVVASFVVSECEEIKLEQINDYSYNTYNYMTETLEENDLLKKSCLHTLELSNYLQGKNGYAWHISQLKIFDRPKELNEFSYHRKQCDNCFAYGSWKCDGICAYNRYNKNNELTKAPQSYCYVEELDS